MRQFLLSLIVCGGLLSAPARADGHLILVGGGKRPAAAMETFRSHAGGAQAQILVIGWASGEPDESFAALQKDLGEQGLVLAPPAPLTPESRAVFLDQLGKASGVWFTGGDQVKIMSVLRDRELLEAVRSKFRAGCTFGGTSAGTAVMSLRMLTGDAEHSVIDASKVEIIEGLGLLPAAVIVDQHFLRRQRENRLFGPVLAREGTVGVGIDEDTAMVFFRGQAQVVGDSQIMLVRRLDHNRLDVRLLRSGDRFELP